MVARQSLVGCFACTCLVGWPVVSAEERGPIVQRQRTRGCCCPSSVVTISYIVNSVNERDVNLLTIVIVIQLSTRGTVESESTLENNDTFYKR